MVGVYAQGTDPFGEVDTSKYPNTMTITGHVLLGTDTLGSDAVVAVYQGSELRGKKSPTSQGSYKNILMMSIFGETKGQPIHFKVWTGGRVIEVDQGVTFTSDQRLGKLKEPYIIYLPVPVVTKPSNEGWATTCLPYDALVPQGVTLWNATGIADSELVMEKMEAGAGDSPTILPANTPVLLQSDGPQSYEWLPRVVYDVVAQPLVSTPQSSVLLGTTKDTSVEPCSVLALGHSDTTGEIGFWLYTGTSVPANRAYIADFPSAARGVTFRFDSGTTTAIDETMSHELRTMSCHDLLGRMVPAGKAGKMLWKKGKHGQTIKIRRP